MEGENKVERKISLKLLIVMVAVLLVLLSIVLARYLKSNKELELVQQDYNELQNAQFKQDSVMNAMEDIFDEIQYNLTFVQEKRGKLFIDSQEGSKDPRKQIVEDVKLMDRMLHESEARIKDLQKQLKKAGLVVPSYEKRIALLQETIKQQNQDILDLQEIVAVQDFKLTDFKQKVEVMDKRIATQKDSIATQLEALKESDKRMYTGYVAYGTMKELKAKNLISTEGAVLGMGGSKELPGDFNQDYFMKVDMRDVTQISLHVKKAELITQHPDKSYHFEEVNGEVKFLSIDNPEEFWKLSRFVLVKVK